MTFEPGFASQWILCSKRFLSGAPVNARLKARQREHGHGAEAGILTQHAQAVANVSNQVLDPIHSPLFAARFLDRLHPAELSQRRVTRFVRVHPRVEVLLRLHLDVRTHLLVHLRVELSLLEQRAQTKMKFSPKVHQFTVGSEVHCQWSAPKSQIPNSKFQINPKHQDPKLVAGSARWSLRFGASLEFGCWNLELSFVSQRLHRIDFGRTASGEQTSQQRDGNKEKDHTRENYLVRWVDLEKLEKLFLQDSCEPERGQESHHDTGAYKASPLSYHHG